MIGSMGEVILTKTGLSWARSRSEHRGCVLLYGVWSASNQGIYAYDHRGVLPSVDVAEDGSLIQSASNAERFLKL